MHISLTYFKLLKKLTNNSCHSDKYNNRHKNASEKYKKLENNITTTGPCLILSMQSQNIFSFNSLMLHNIWTKHGSVCTNSNN